MAPLTVFKQAGYTIKRGSINKAISVTVRVGLSVRTKQSKKLGGNTRTDEQTQIRHSQRIITGIHH